MSLSNVENLGSKNVQLPFTYFQVYCQCQPGASQERARAYLKGSSLPDNREEWSKFRHRNVGYDLLSMHLKYETYINDGVHMGNMVEQLSRDNLVMYH